MADHAPPLKRALLRGKPEIPPPVVGPYSELTLGVAIGIVLLVATIVCGAAVLVAMFRHAHAPTQPVTSELTQRCDTDYLLALELVERGVDVNESGVRWLERHGRTWLDAQAGVARGESSDRAWHVCLGD